ncbi:MAG: hypothetical protein GY898_10910 [Proteobacteria bacterium]|nr:hypothetical protein [Pseudomonadota bacterium]
MKYALALAVVVIGCGTPAPEPVAPPPDPTDETPASNASGCPSDDVCVAPYEAFIGKAAAFARPVTDAALTEQLAAITAANTNTVQERPTPEALRAGLIDAANLGPLLADLAPRSPVMTVGEGGAVIIEDPWIGLLEGLLLLPPGGDPVGGVVAHPGHGETAEQHIAQRGGRELADAGLAVLVVRPRAHAGDEVSAALARTLLLAGHSLVGLRTYEVLVAARALGAHPRVDPARIGLHGHSGGSVVGHLAVRVDDSFVAFVGDLMSTYGVPGAESGAISDETSPLLYPWHPWLEEPTTTAAAIHAEEYGFPAGVGAGVQFLAGRLAP